MPPQFHQTLLRPAATIAATLLIAACGPAQQGGFQGFPPAEVTTLAVQPRDFPVAFEYVAQTTGSKDVEVRARVTGIIEKRLYQEGSAVKAGQPLFTIDPATYQAQVNAADADLARAEAQKAQADRELARLKPLAERKAVGQKEADDAASNADLAAAAVKSARAKLDELKVNLGYTRVVAPIAGLSSRAMKSEGSLATANDTLLTVISQVDPIWVVFNVSENDELKLQRAVTAGQLSLPKDNAYDVTIRLADGSTFPRRGRINFADTRVNPTTGTYEMRAEVGNSDAALKPGQFVRAVLRGAQRKNAIAVPQVAVLDGPQGKFVYVVGKDKDGKEVAQPRPVVVGDWVDGDGGNLWVIESGLKPGDVVVVDGVAKLLVGAPIKTASAAAPAGKAAAKPAPSDSEPMKSEAAATAPPATAPSGKARATPAPSAGEPTNSEVAATTTPSTAPAKSQPAAKSASAAPKP
jgi:membrane fusion protein (multidrug efflux system)